MLIKPERIALRFFLIYNHYIRANKYYEVDDYMKNRTFALVMALVLAAFCVGCGDGSGTVTSTEPVSVETNEVTDVSTEEEATGDFQFLEVLSEEKEEENYGAMLGINMLENGDFSDGNTNWDTYICQGGSGTFLVKQEQAEVKIINTGSVNYSVQLYYDGFKLLTGGVYEISMDINSTLARNIGVRAQLNGGDYHGYFDEFSDIQAGDNHMSWQFTMEEDSDLAPRFCLNLGTPNGSSVLEEHTIMVDNVEIKLIDDTNVIKPDTEDSSIAVNLNQVGFLPNARKTVVVKSRGITSEFNLVDEAGNTVYTGHLTGPVEAQYANELVYQGDFSDFKEPGKYTVRVSNGDESYPFEIGQNVYDELLKDSFLFLYKQRCGMAIEGDIAGKIAHPECHNTPALIYGTNEYKDVSGGWHDAGDYGRYINPGATTVTDLLLTYEDYPELWSSDDLGIPESGNGIPDILDEARYELDWMLKMQDEASGGVYHKVTCREFPGFVMPEEETAELVISPISITATGDFAAVMAMASRVYKDIDPEFANNALEAAKRAWDYLEANPKKGGFKNPSDIVTGEYPDSEDKDERYWAACELLKVTGEKKYRDYAEYMIDQYVPFGLGWDDMGTYGNMAYLSLDPSLQKPELVEKVLKKVRQKAIEYRDNTIKDGYMVDLGSNYCWGSNMIVSNNARQMLFAAKYAPDIEGLDIASYDQISYLLGQNTLSYSFLSGYGTKYPVNAHHRPSIATSSLVTGMVIGGPDGSFEDPYAKAVLSGLPPAKSYADNTQSYSTNEVTIYWNSPFTYLLSAIIDNNK